jgi:hypothetical protein
MIARITYELENRELKGTYRYREVTEEETQPPVAPYIYIKKYVLGKKPPKRLTITIEEIGEQRSS